MIKWDNDFRESSYEPATRAKLRSVREPAALDTSKEFILPGGVPSSAFAHVARTVCRRAERKLFRLTELDAPPANFGLPYLNRLSDLLFVASRLENRAAGHSDVLWEPDKSSDKGPEL
jgi:cob(I)alamin adenosyltransferase